MHKRNGYINGINTTFLPVTLGHKTFIMNPADLSMCYIFAAIYPIIIWSVKWNSENPKKLHISKFTTQMGKPGV